MFEFSFKIDFQLFTFPLHFRQETDAATEEQSTFLAYDKRVKELAQELTESQVCSIIRIVRIICSNFYDNLAL